MQHFSISGTIRESMGKAALKALRAEGLVPCNLYGADQKNVLFTVSAKALKAVTNTPKSYIIDVTLDNGSTYTAILHELQWHPVTDECLHVDFLAVSDAKPVCINVPIEITGHAVGVQQGGKFYQTSREVRICAPLSSLPDKVVVNISKLGLNQRIKAGELVVEGASVITDKDTIICGVKATRNSAAA